MWKYGFTNIRSFTFCLSTFLFFHLFTFSPSGVHLLISALPPVIKASTSSAETML